MRKFCIFLILTKLFSSILRFYIFILKISIMAKAKIVSRDLVNSYTIGGGAFSIIPIPGIHSIGLTVAEAKLAADIARIYGLKPIGIIWTIILKGIMLHCGGSLLLKGLGEFLNVIPIFGWLAKPLVASTVIKGFGELVILYFEDRFPEQEAYVKPTLKKMLIAFSGAAAAHEITEWYHKND